MSDNRATVLLRSLVEELMNNDAYSIAFQEPAKPVETPPVVFTASFSGRNGITHSVEISEASDEALEEGLKKVEAVVGKLERGSGLGFPDFTIFENGVEIAGG